MAYTADFYLNVNDNSGADFLRGLNYVLPQIEAKATARPYQRAHPVLMALTGKAGKDFPTPTPLPGMTHMSSNVLNWSVELTAPTGSIGVTAYNELSASTIRRPMPTVASAVIAHFRDGFYITQREKSLLMSGKTKAFVDVLEQRIANLQENFRVQQSTNLGGGGKDAENAWMGIAYPLSTSNAPGNIDQSDSNNTRWRANVTTSAGSFTPLLLDQMRTKIARYGHMPNLWLFSAESGGIDVFTLYKDQYRGGVLFEVNNEMMNVGISNIREQGGAVCVQDFWWTPASSTAEIAALDTRTWHIVSANSSVEPTRTAEYVPPGTDAMAYVYSNLSQIVCSNPIANGIIKGIA